MIIRFWTNSIQIRGRMRSIWEGACSMWKGICVLDDGCAAIQDTYSPIPRQEFAL